MKNELTPKQLKVLTYLEKSVRDNGRIPSLREAAGHLGISHTAVSRFIAALEEKGYLYREGRYSRGIYLLGKDKPGEPEHNLRRIGIIGGIKAGVPMYAQEEWNGSIMVDGNVFPDDNLFALRVKGESMREAAILPGDLVICRPRQYAENGEIIVALIKNEEATLKRFFLHEDHIELRPENRQMAPLHYSFDEVLIQGKVIGVIREPFYTEAL